MVKKYLIDDYELSYTDQDQTNISPTMRKCSERNSDKNRKREERRGEERGGGEEGE